MGHLCQFDKIFENSTHTIWPQSQGASQKIKMFSVKECYARSPRVPLIEKEVIIKQAHESFIVLGGTEDEDPTDKDKTEEVIETKSSAKPVSAPFHDVDLSRLRSPNMPYIGKKQRTSDARVRSRSNSPMKNRKYKNRGALNGRVVLRSPAMVSAWTGKKMSSLRMIPSEEEAEKISQDTDHGK